MFTPENVIGATLPNGARVVSAKLDGDGDLVLTFDPPQDYSAYTPDGRHFAGYTPALTPTPNLRAELIRIRDEINTLLSTLS